MSWRTFCPVVDNNRLMLGSTDGVVVRLEAVEAEVMAKVTWRVLRAVQKDLLRQIQEARDELAMQLGPRVELDPDRTDEEIEREWDLRENDPDAKHERKGNK